MFDDLFVGEWMPLYWQTFLDDVQHLVPELLGGYVLLLGHQWKEGSIPAEPMMQAAIAKLSVAKTRTLMRALGDRFAPHPAAPNALANAFMERVREEQRAKFESGSRRGRRAATARWGHHSTDAPSNAPGIENDAPSIAPRIENHASSNARGNADIENRDQDHLASLGDPGAGARTREGIAQTPAFAFCLWMLKTGIERAAIPGHHAQDEFAWCWRHFDDAQVLVANYGENEPRVRGERLITAKAQRRIRRDVTPKTLLDAWDWDEIRGAHDLRGGTEVEDDFIRRLREREERNNG